ncbi:MAG: ABC transporter permease [Candidatus Firestonebacteria bacterium RIFOXYC2_FULL_39_67]|nr:MAG: ABC transporter permease [Candidatus Firestonebacteria bacterium RIFOXYD2_FULL_39_29]OGF55198.1 MAG: ABC transporter permease [Candidatus Firestonebacteria bacterium RIFOXYC2_FULL_39_67]OGF57863.1 MAG: ABC transporter permease [Candidatus Firestonebacteria bacterium RifOxyC12_full_39_7]
MFFQQIVNGITLGGVYALVALGYTMVYGVLEFINFAHGEIYMVGAYWALFTLGLFNVSLLSGPGLFFALCVVFLSSILFCSILGVIIEKVAYKPLRNSPRLAPLITSLGVSIVLQNAVMLIAGAENKKFDVNFPDTGINIGNVYISYINVFIIAVSVLLMILLNYFVRKTKLGKAMRAVAEDKKTASLMGINVDGIISLTFLLGSALAAVAGVMISISYGMINFSMGYMVGLKAFTAAVLGGIGSIPGAMFGGILLGLIESLGAGYISSTYKDVISFAILILVLIFRPRGLFGSKQSK